MKNTRKYTRITVCWDGAFDIHMTSHHIDATAYHFHSLCSEIKPFLELVFFCLSFFWHKSILFDLPSNVWVLGIESDWGNATKKHALGHQNKSLKHEKQKWEGGEKKPIFWELLTFVKGSHILSTIFFTCRFVCFFVAAHPTTTHNHTSTSKLGDFSVLVWNLTLNPKPSHPPHTTKIDLNNLTIAADIKAKHDKLE